VHGEFVYVNYVAVCMYLGFFYYLMLFYCHLSGCLQFYLAVKYVRKDTFVDIMYCIYDSIFEQHPCI
jgi:hypothetical protein